MSQPWAEAIVRRVAALGWAAPALYCLAIALAWGVATVRHDPARPLVDNSIGIWFLEDDEALVRYREFQALFGQDEVVLVAWREPETVFTPAALDLVADVSRRLAALPEVHGVTSLATVLHAEGGDEVRVERLYRAPVDAAGALAVRDKVRADPLIGGHIVSKDERTSLISVQPRAERLEDLDAIRADLLRGVRAAVDAAFAAAGRDPQDPDGGWRWGGGGVVNEALNEASQRDSGLFTGLSLLVIAGVLWAMFRRLGAALVAIAAVGMATALLMGLYVATGHALNMVTAALPSLVLVIGLTDAIYFISAWQQEREALLAQGLSRREAVARAVAPCFVPGLFNSITASAGFLAFATAKMEVIRTFGIFAGLGIALAFLSSLVVCTAAFQRFDLGAPRAPGAAPRTEAALVGLARLVGRRRGWVLGGCALVVGLAVAGVLRLRVDSDPVRYFYEDHPLRQHDAFFAAAYGPYLPLELIVDTGEVNGVTRPEVLRAVEALQTRLADREPRLAGGASIAGVVRRLHEVLGDEDALPATREAAEQLLLWYDPDRADDPLRLVDAPDWRRARITLRGESLGAAEGTALLERIRADGRELIEPVGARLEPAGYGPLYLRLIDHLVSGQMSSLLTTSLVIVVVLAVLFRSVRYALLSLPANVVPVVATLGFMGWTGIALDGATVLIASIALGVAVDDTIHFVFRLRELAESGKDDPAALEETMRTTGRAILASSIVIALGFAVVSLASLKSVALFGVLTAVTMVSALLGELVITPAVVLLFARRPTSRADGVTG
ncbi:MAG: MMPL family transporter [Planctomycetes bacterium]|nr:MMPL family transporter [Planctomycetota bacterium]